MQTMWPAICDQWHKECAENHQRTKMRLMIAPLLAFILGMILFLIIGYFDCRYWGGLFTICDRYWTVNEFICLHFLPNVLCFQ